MNAPVTVQAEEVAKIEEALDRLVTAYLRYRNEPRIGGEPGMVSAGAGAMRVIDRMGFTEAQRLADDLLERPVAQALRNAIGTCGERLNEIGGDVAMLDAYYRVSAADPANEARRQGAISGKWDGIGGWLA